MPYAARYSTLLIPVIHLGFVLATFGWLNAQAGVLGRFPVLKGTSQESMQALGTTSVKVFLINPRDEPTFP